LQFVGQILDADDAKEEEAKNAAPQAKNEDREYEERLNELMRRRADERVYRPMEQQDEKSDDWVGECIEQLNSLKSPPWALEQVASAVCLILTPAKPPSFANFLAILNHRYPRSSHHQLAAKVASPTPSDNVGSRIGSSTTETFGSAVLKKWVRETTTQGNKSGPMSDYTLSELAKIVFPSTSGSGEKAVKGGDGKEEATFTGGYVAKINRLCSVLCEWARLVFAHATLIRKQLRLAQPDENNANQEEEDENLVI
jgi:hypothetical protein